MNWETTIIVCTVIALLALFPGRWLYRRSVMMRNRLQMSMVFTNITHEILTPLTILSASIELMRNSTPQNNEEYDMMELNIQRIVRLLQQILETSKSQSGELKLLVSYGDVMEYIRNVALCVKPLMVKKGQQFHVTCSPESMRGWIDPDKLDKIIFNLLSNAAKYAGENGIIELEAHTNKTYDHIIIQVRDNGKGISKERRKHLFDRFYDGEYRKNHTMGTGLGLALAKDLASLHRGSIRCESEEGRGTTFTVVLPISKEKFSKDQIDEKNAIQLNLPKTNISDIPVNFRVPEMTKEQEPGLPDEDAYKLLLVEDNMGLLLLMKHLLKSQYTVYTASNGKEALDIIENQDLDLIVSDVMMPVMNGNELTRHIKNTPDYRHLPVILLTAMTQEEDRTESLLLGADDYITKPFKMGELRLRINNIIENRQRIQSEFKDKTKEELDLRIQEEDNGTEDNSFMKKAIECVARNMDDADFDRERFANDMNMSSSSLYNKLRALTGMSVSSFIRDMRMKEAQRIAKDNPDIRISDLAYKVGFRDPKYFATIFKKTFGLQPTEYLQEQKNRSSLLTGTAKP